MTRTWDDLFERAPRGVTVEQITDALAERRAADTERETTEANDTPADTTPPGGRPGPARVVADADVLAADLLVGGDARRAIDVLRAHSWTALIASDPLLDDAAAVIEDLAGGDLAADWCERATDFATLVAHPAGDHPALASALHGRAAHLLTFDADLTTARAAASIRPHVETSPKTPAAFAATADPAALYAAVHDTDPDAYPGPD